MWHVTNLFQKWFGIIKQLLFLIEVEMTIYSPSTDYIHLGFHPRALLPASGVKIVMSPSLKGNNCILLYLINVHWLCGFQLVQSRSRGGCYSVMLHGHITLLCHICLKSAAAFVYSAHGRCYSIMSHGPITL